MYARQIVPMTDENIPCTDWMEWPELFEVITKVRSIHGRPQALEVQGNQVRILWGVPHNRSPYATRLVSYDGPQYLLPVYSLGGGQ